ncbi:MAG: hypothetical protein IJ455_08210 [Agathobacter sp.]|nr:hypothetical protein [Agathobacter sp.]
MSKDKASQKISGSKQYKPNRRPVILVSIAAMVLVIGGILAWFVFGEDEEPNIVVTPDNVEDLLADREEQEATPMGSFEVMMTTTWTFPNSKSASTDAYIANSINNRNTVYFTITLEGNEEPLYTSPYIPVGSRMENVTLNSDLEAGTYDTVLTYHLVDGEYQDISEVSVALEIIIEK